MYNSYEEYMQSVLGMNMPNTYMPNSGYYEPRFQEENMPDTNRLYPEIYGIVYPMVQKACSKIRGVAVSNSQIDSMVDEVYSSLVPGDDILQGKDNGSTPRNGDVKNPRVKEERRPNNKNENAILRDLIRILILREIFGGPQRPGMPRPPMGWMQGGNPFGPRKYAGCTPEEDHLL